MTRTYKIFDEDFIEDFHDRIFMYRKLYQGKHGEIFKRAERLIQEGQAIDNVLKHQKEGVNMPTPYIVANFAKLIVNTPAVLVSRSIGDITTSLENDGDTTAGEATEQEIEGPDDKTINGTILNVQQELIRQIVKNSKLNMKHKSNIVQQQIDGGLVGVPWDDSRGIRVEFKARDVYFPHEDELGADLTYTRTFNEKEYLHVYRERIENTAGPGKPYLHAQHFLYDKSKAGTIQEEPLPDDVAADLMSMDVDDLENVYEGRSTLFIRYWANDPTIMDPLGVSALSGQENKQDEINWTLTTTASIFERNGKPRLAINQEMATAMTQQMVEMYGEEARGKFDYKNFEVVTMDANGKSIEIIQIDIGKLGGVDWVKDIIKMMLMETQTSEKAIDFYMGETQAGAQSGVAKFYDLFLSLMKAEDIRKEYIFFLKGLLEDATWLANLNDPSIQIEEPNIQVLNMMPIQRKELIEENMSAFAGQNGKSAQSLETTIRKMNPGASEDWVQDEMARVQTEQISLDSNSGIGAGAQTLESMFDNQDKRPTPNAPAATPTDPLNTPNEG